MFEIIEKFCKAHEYTIAALGSVGTLLAVLVSLWLGLLSIRASRTHLRAYATITTVVPPGVLAANATQFVTTEITNTGSVPARIPFSYFRLRLPFQRGVTLFQPCDAFVGQIIPKRPYPVDLPPNTSVSLFVCDLPQFRKNLAEIKAELSWFGKLRFRWFRLRIMTDDGRWFRIRIDGILRKNIRDLR
ncbi:MAG: hypothetical protein WCA81_02335 [Rhizomicrobium sp.]